MPSGNSAQSELSLPTLITNQRNAPTVLPSGQSVGGAYSIEVPSSQMTLACVQLTRKLTRTDGMDYIDYPMLEQLLLP